MNVISKLILLNRYNTFLVLILLSSSIQSAPITFNTALPVAEAEYIFREQLVISQSGNDPSGVNRNRTEVTAITAMGYGINHRWTLFGVLPYRNIELDLDSNDQRINRSNYGFGDISLFTRYSAYQKNKLGQTFRIAPFIGFKAPYGKSNVADNRGTLPASVQLSSGSWDYFGGVVLTWQTLKYQIDTQLSYRVNNEYKGFEAGNTSRLDASFQYRIWRSSVTGTLPDYFYGVVEANWINQDRNRTNGVSDDNSNGTRLFLSPGVQYVTKRWIAETALQIPISQNLNGTALENKYIARAGMRFNF